MTPDQPPWVSWAPPLDPPTPGGLPAGQAEQIAAAWWDDEPHRAAAEMWEAYAATLPPSASVSSVQTGAQSVVYAPAMAGGDYGLAISRAQWHRSMCSTAESVPLIRDLPIPVCPARREPWRYLP